MALLMRAGLMPDDFTREGLHKRAGKEGANP